MLVKITKCESGFYWYAGKVGHHYIVDEEHSDNVHYRVLCDDLLWIRAEDCVKVDKWDDIEK